MKNTVTLVVVTDLLKFFIGLGLALLLNEKIKGRDIFRSFILLPWAMPGFVAFLTWRLLFLPIGGGIDLILQHFPGLRMMRQGRTIAPNAPRKSGALGRRQRGQGRYAAVECLCVALRHPSADGA